MASPSGSSDGNVVEQTRASRSLGAAGAMLTVGARGAVFRIVTGSDVTGSPDETASRGVTRTATACPLPKWVPSRVGESPPAGAPSTSHSCMYVGESPSASSHPDGSAVRVVSVYAGAGVIVTAVMDGGVPGVGSLSPPPPPPPPRETHAPPTRARAHAAATRRADREGPWARGG